jgi:S-DNA-T family DNA segregation ATPase FtsK/SpoIIIE
VPSIVEVDGRPVPTTSLLVDSTIRTGSVVSTRPGAGTEPDEAPVRLVQLAGPGTGRTSPLRPGRYRVGPGRKISDHELRTAPVESTAFELDVDTDGDVHVTAFADDVRIDGGPPPTRVHLGDRVLSTTTRAFVLETPRGDDPGDRLDAHPGPDGTVVVNRPARAGATAGAPRPVVDALAAARHRSTMLWQRRPGDGDAFTVSVGVTVDDGCRSITVPFRAATEPPTVDGVGVVGSEPMRLGLARSMLAELATAHAPNDLRLVVVTRRPETWEWAKWLPHLHVDGRALIVRAGELTAVVDDGTTTVVVLDETADWTRADAPLRGRLAALPATTSVLALCSTRSEVPAICTTTIDEARNGRVSITGRRRASIDGVIPAIADEATVEHLARCLAPLVDADELDEQPTTTDWMAISGLPRDLDADGLRALWSTGDAEVPEPLSVVRGASSRAAFDVAVGLAIGRTVRHRPDRVRILPVTDRDSALGRLPHADAALALGETDGRPTLGAVGVDRLERRLRSLLSEPAGPDHVVLVVDAARDGIDERVTPAVELAALAGAGVSVIIATDSPDLSFSDATTTVTVDEATRHTRLCSTGPDGEHVHVLGRADASGLDLRPYRIGHRSTDAERRIDRQRARGVDPDLERLVGLANDAADPAAAVRSLAPPPPPGPLRFDELLDRHPGDGLPLGEVDRPDLDADPPWWWQPGRGSVIAIGGDGSAAGGLVDAVLAGVSARFGDDDVALAVIASTDERRDAAAALPHTQVAVLLDDVDAPLLDQVDGLRREAGRPVVLLVDDLAECRRAVDADERLDLWVRHGDVVATAPTAAEIEEFLASFPHRLLGPTEDVTDAALLGVRRPPTGAGDVVEAGTDAIIHLGVPSPRRAAERSTPEGSP